MPYSLLPTPYSLHLNGFPEHRAQRFCGNPFDENE